MDHVTLELCSDSCVSQSGRDLKHTLAIKAWTLTEEGWDALTDETGDIGRQDFDIVVQRHVLAAKSTYFRGLFSGFREAGFDRIKVTWEATTFFYLLQFIYCGHLDISSSKAAGLLEAASFFGVDAAILAVEEWARSATTTRDEGVINDVLESLPCIWDTSNMLGHHYLSKFCPEFLAVNFVIVMALSSFLDLPCTLLNACITHPQLTVHSEKQLCEALLRWYEKQVQGSGFGRQEMESLMSILSQVRRTFLPKDFLLARLPENCPLDVSNSIIRITSYLDFLDLSGCFEVTDFTLFTSCACAPMRLDEDPKTNGSSPILEPSLNTSNTNMHNPMLALSFYDIPTRQPNWPKIPSFINLKGLNLSQCWRIPQNSLVIWLREACPNLLELILVNCPQITISILQALAAFCPLLELADFSLEVTHFDSIEVLKYITDYKAVGISGDAAGLWRCSCPNLTRLSLRGHCETSDLILIAIAACAPALVEIDLSMCSALTDGGIARFLKSYPNGLQSLRARQTAFGSRSCRALSETNLSIEPSKGIVSSLSCTWSLPLTTLDLESCYGAGEEDLASILKTHSSLTHLSLGQTNLTDTALSQFRGLYLQQVSVRETQVSGQALVSIIRSSPNLRSLDVRGCKRVCFDRMTERDGDMWAAHDVTYGVPLIFQDLGRQHIMEDLKVGWRFSDLAQEAVRRASHCLKIFSVGVGGTITDDSLRSLAEHATSLEQLTLCFQAISEDGVVHLLSKCVCLRVLELQYCLLHLSSRGINALAAGCGSTLTTLKLERVVSWMVDADVNHLSKRCTRLSQLSLVGCKALTAESLRTIAKNWRGLTWLKLEECKGLTNDGADSLLQSCGALEVLTLRHNGKGLAKDFIIDSLIQFPLLRYLSLDMCDAVADGFQTPNQVDGPLNTLLIARCKPPKHAFQWVSTSAERSRSSEQCHKDTIVTQWRVGQHEVYIARNRLGVQL